MNVEKGYGKVEKRRAKCLYLSQIGHLFVLKSLKIPLNVHNVPLKRSLPKILSLIIPLKFHIIVNATCLKTSERRPG